MLAEELKKDPPEALQEFLFRQPAAGVSLRRSAAHSDQ